MATKTNLGWRSPQRYVGNASEALEEGKTDSSEVFYGRVVDVILDMSHEKIKSLGGTQALYGIFFQPLFVATTEESPDYGDRFAYCGQQNFRQIPIKGEIVKIVYQAAGSVSETKFKSNGNVTRAYWTEIVPVWNHPHLNYYPDTVAMTKEHKQADFGKDFKENSDIKPLQLNAGDITIEGRHGQSLRFGGTSSDNSPLAKSDTNGKPYTILRNGQKSTQGDTVYEDVNDDDSSIYLVSDHKVPITEANRKFKGATKAPEATAKYQGKQIVANSDRIVINAREDNLTLAAKKHASINADTVSVDGEKYIGLDASKIYLGTKAQKENEPVLLGMTSIGHLRNFYTNLMTICQTTSAALGGAGMTAWEKGPGAAAFQSIVQLCNDRIGHLNKLLSRKVYTE